MAKDNYNLRDWGYFKLLQLISEGLNFQEIDYALVGGGAVQAIIAHAFNAYENMTAPEIPEPMMRKTKDFDITTRSSEEDLVCFLNELQAENQPLSIKPKQARRVNLTYQSRRNVQPIVITLNYQTGPHDFSGLGEAFYNECLDTAEDLFLTYNNEEARVRVATPECIIASKLTRASPKDIVDISALLRSLLCYEKKGAPSFNYGTVRRYLEEAGKAHCYENLTAIVSEVLKE